MNRYTCLFAALALVTVGTGCAGRTAAWEADDAADATKTTETTDAAAATVDHAAEAMTHWDARTSPDAIRQAIAEWEKAVEANPADAESLTMLTRANYLLADGYLRDNDEAYLATMDAGVKWGEKAMMASSAKFAERMKNGDKLEEAIEEIGADGIGALYWYATNLGKWAKKEGFAVLLGQKDKVKAIMERCLKLDPNYFHGAPDRYFGAFYAIAPAFAGGDLTKSEEHFKKSLELAPNYIGTRVLMAENLAPKKQDPAMFDEQLKLVLEAADDVIPELKAEIAVEKTKAKELQAKKEDLF